MKKVFFLLLLPLLSFVPFGNDVDVFFGDSITFGNELGSQQYSHRWSAQYCAAVPSVEVNEARSGASMAPNPYNRPVFNINDVPAYQSDFRHIFVSYWVNDFLYGSTTAAFAAATSAAVDGILAKGWPPAKIVLCFNYLPDVGPNQWPFTTDAVARQWLAALRGVKAAKGTSFLDFYTPIYNRPDKASYSLDNVHPTAAWNVIMKAYAQTNIEAPSAGALPVTFTGLSARRVGAKNEVRWSVAGEQNIRRYEVERSTNGSAWTKLGEVAATGNGSAAQAYSFTDAAPAGDKQHYRVRAIEANGSAKQSGVVIVSAAKSGKLSFGGLFPNPAASTVTLLVAAPKEYASTTLEVLDATGRTVKVVGRRMDAGTNSVGLPVSELRSGNYFIRLTAGTDRVTTSFVKQ